MPNIIWFNFNLSSLFEIKYFLKGYALGKNPDSLI